MRGAEDHFGQFTGAVAGPSAVVETLSRHLGPLLDLAEYSARIAVRDRYGPWLAQQPPSDHWAHRRPVLRRRWHLDYLSGFGQAYADRIAAAFAGRRDAAVGAFGYRSGEPGMHGRAEAEARGDVARLDPQRFHALAIAIGAPPPAPQEPPIAAVREQDNLELRDAGARFAVTDARRRGSDRIAALTAIAEAWHVRIAVDPDQRHCAVAVGHPRLSGLFAANAARLALVMDSAARRRRGAGPVRDDEEHARRLRADADRYAALLRARTGGLAGPNRHRNGGALADAAGSAAMHIAGVVFPHLLGECGNATEVVAVAPGAFSRSSDRATVITALAGACGLTATAQGVIEEGRSWERVRQVMRLDGPAPVLAAFIDALPRVIAEADQALAVSLPDCEALLDSRLRTARDPRTRTRRREAWTTAVMAGFGRHLARRLAPTLDTPPGAVSAPPRVRVTAAESKAARAGVDAVDPSGLAALSDAIGSAWNRTRNSWAEDRDSATPSARAAAS